MPSKPQIGPEERRRMIAEAAYFRASNRGFEAGHAESDWLAAELEIDAQYGCGEHAETEISGLYERLAEESCRHAWEQLRSRSGPSEVGTESTVGTALEHAEIIRQFCQRLADVNQAICELAEKPVSVATAGYPQKFRRVRQLRRQLADTVTEMRRLSGSECDKLAAQAERILTEIDSDIRGLRAEVG